MAHSHFVNAFSRISYSKNYVFRFQIFCHIDLMLLFFFVVFNGGWWDLVLYPITMYSFKSEIQKQQCSNNVKFCAYHDMHSLISAFVVCWLASL